MYFLHGRPCLYVIFSSLTQGRDEICSKDTTSFEAFPKSKARGYEINPI